MKTTATTSRQFSRGKAQATRSTPCTYLPKEDCTHLPHFHRNCVVQLHQPSAQIELLRFRVVEVHGVGSDHLALRYLTNVISQLHQTITNNAYQQCNSTLGNSISEVSSPEEISMRRLPPFILSIKEKCHHLPFRTTSAARSCGHTTHKT